MHLIRLLLSGIAVLRERFVLLRVDEHREILLSIRRGEVPWQEVERWRVALRRELDGALATTSLPRQPDFEMANEFLLAARRLAALAWFDQWLKPQDIGILDGPHFRYVIPELEGWRTINSWPLLEVRSHAYALRVGGISAKTRANPDPEPT